MKIRVSYAVELDDNTIRRLADRAPALGVALSTPGIIFRSLLFRSEDH